MENIVSRLHVCFINVTRGIGGVERVVERHAVNLDSSRFQLSYAYTPFTGDDLHVAQLRKAGVTIIPIRGIFPLSPNGPSTPPARAKQSATWCWKKLVPVRIDELVFHLRNTTRLTHAFEGALSSLPQPPDIFQLSAGDYFWMAAACTTCRRNYPKAKTKLHLGNPPVFLNPTFLERRMFRDADSVSFVSKDTRKAWEKSLGFVLPQARVLRTPVATDTIPFIQRVKTSATDAFVLLTAGRLSPIKGIDIALQAVRQLRDSSFHVVLWIIGSGPDEPRLRQLTQELGLNEHVKFLGFMSEPTLLFPQADFLLQPSTHTEGVPNSVLEAMASGLPVIASRIGGIPEIIVDNETGVLVDPGNPGQITDTVIKLIRDATLRNRIGLAGSEYVRRNNSAPIATASLARIYESLVSGMPAMATEWS